MRLPETVERVLAALREGKGELAGSARAALIERAAGHASGDAPAGVPAPLVDYADKVARDATAIGEQDFTALRAAGIPEEQVFEATLAAAVGAGLARLEAVLRAVGDGADAPARPAS